MVDGVIIIIFTTVPFFLSLSLFILFPSATVRQGINGSSIESSWPLKWTPLQSINVQRRFIFICLLIVVVVF
jgi:hypothetical protein